MQKIIERIKQIVLKPRETWEAINTEEATIAGILKDYFLLLAAVPAVAMFLGNWIVGYRLPFRFGFSFRGIVRLSFVESLFTAVIWYLLTVAGVWVMGKIISLLAPKFGSTQDDVKGFKVAVYSYTPYLAAGILLIIPSLGGLTFLAGLYGLYLLYVGLPIVMGTPKEKSLPYIVVIIVALFLIYIIVTSVTASISGAFGPSIFIGE